MYQICGMQAVIFGMSRIVERPDERVTINPTGKLLVSNGNCIPAKPCCELLQNAALFFLCMPCGKQAYTKVLRAGLFKGSVLITNAYCFCMRAKWAKAQGRYSSFHYERTAMKPAYLLTALALSLLPAASVFADHDDRDDWEDKRRRHHHHHHEVFMDGGCKVERTWKRNGDYKEKRECKSARRPVRVVVSKPPVVVYPPWFEQQPPQVYEPPRSSRRQPVYRCDSATGAAILGGILGGVAGHQVGNGSGQTAATIGGAIAGVLIGGEIGKRMDADNQACIGQALEAAPAGGSLNWAASHNPNVRYVVVPGEAERRGDTWCRSYTATIISHGRHEQVRQMACRQPDGVWFRHS
jgi:surface antigen